ncbi:MAG TPA: serine/threonine-protein kinase [Kofleriaceae bacterium]|nr:serine/threonine-protein kinase [Kofleriaceae bacterium]
MEFRGPAPTPQPVVDRTEHPDAPLAPEPDAAEQAGLVPGARVYQYELIRELGRGGMGRVFAARDTRLGRRVAMKLLLRASPGIAERFLVEARATARCQHENIVIIHEVNEIGGMPFMVLEYLEGQSLREAMRGPLPWVQAAELMIPVARALVRAHELGILHRDLKPENIFLTETGGVKVLDFGIAKALSEQGGKVPGASTTQPGLGSPDLHLTQDGTIVGTLPYMSPEQCGLGAVDHRSDLWAAGIILFEMLAGRHPLDPVTPTRLIENAVQLEHPMPSIRDAVAIPEPLARLVDGCLRKAKAERPASAADLLAVLEDALPGRRGRRLAEGESPYPGLTAFQESDADRFFGRARDVARMVARIRESPLTAVVGPSGVGKSSFVRAGVVPALKASGETWETIVVRPGRGPLAALASVLQPMHSSSRTDVHQRMEEHEALLARLRAEPGYLGTLLRGWARQNGCKILLFVDQFEELYTLVPDVAERAGFVACLAGVADDAATPLRVVVSMRSDFLDRVGEDAAFLDALSRSLVFLSAPDRAGLREALVQPLEMVGYRFESDRMVEAMLSELEATAGALPLLQFAAGKLWDGRDRGRRLLTEAGSQAIGGIAGALAAHADEVLAAMTPGAQRLTRAVLVRLVTPERTRAILDTAELHQIAPDGDEVRRVIDQLVNARLLVVQKRGESGASAEIVHESLIERWPTLRRWLDEGQEDAAFLEQLRTAAQQWEARGRPAGLLWRGEAMEEAQRWRRRSERELPRREEEYLAAVFALASRASRMRRVAVVATMVLLALIAAGAVVALVWIRQAEQDAKKQADIALTETAKAQAAEKKVTEQLELVQREQAEKIAAEKERAAAEAGFVAAQQEKALVEIEKRKVDQDLERSNAELKRALARAEEARAAAEKAAADADRARREAQELYRREKQRREEIEKGGLSKTLKD